MLFFFSSRRRHTRLQGDWSSDVCSSDLTHDDDPLAPVETVHFRQQLVERLFALLVATHRCLDPDLAEGVELVDEDDARSEERRVGKEGRSRWWVHESKKGEGERVRRSAA